MDVRPGMAPTIIPTITPAVANSIVSIVRLFDNAVNIVSNIAILLYKKSVCRGI